MLKNIIGLNKLRPYFKNENSCIDDVVFINITYFKEL